MSSCSQIQKCETISQPYCPISHLVMSLYPSRGWPEVLISMFTVYFDASGNEKDQGYMAVAGFVSSTREWVKFSEKWNARLIIEGVDYFRGSEAQSLTGPFKKAWEGLDENTWHAKRDQLKRDLIDIIQAHVFQKFACGIRITEYATRLSEEAKKRGRINAYVMCAMACAERARKWAGREAIRTPLEYVYEEGDDGWGFLKEQFELGNFPEPKPGTKKDKNRQGIIYPAVVPLQAADLFAHECFTIYKMMDLKRKPTKDRPIFQFKQINGNIMRFHDEKLQQLDLHLKKRMPIKIGMLWGYS